MRGIYIRRFINKICFRILITILIKIYGSCYKIRIDNVCVCVCVFVQCLCQFIFILFEFETTTTTVYLMKFYWMYFNQFCEITIFFPFSLAPQSYFRLCCAWVIKIGDIEFSAVYIVLEKYYPACAYIVYQCVVCMSQHWLRAIHYIYTWLVFQAFRLNKLRQPIARSNNIAI